MADALVTRLRQLAGTDAVRQGADLPAVRGVSPRALVEPADADAVAAVVAEAAREGWRVEPAGGCTRLDGGRTPAGVDVVLSTRRLTGATEYDPDELTVTVRAGESHAALADRVGANGQWLPLDPPVRSAATVGATLATAAAGPLRAAYGTPRDYALGLSFVDGAGHVLRVGGRVVKNVAGYDLVRLLVGSRGTLGVLTAATLRLYARPARDVVLGFRAHDAGAAAAAAGRIRAERLEPAALEIVSPGLVAEGSTEGRGGRQAAGPWLLIARLTGGEERVEDLGRRVAAAADLPVAEGADDVLARVAEAEATSPGVLRLARPPACLAETLEAALALARALGGGGAPDGGAPGGGPCVVAHAADGIVRLLVGPGEVGPAGAHAADAVDAAREELAGAGHPGQHGTLVVDRAAGVLKEADPFGPVDPHVLAIMRELKRRFDPAGVLAPGRYVV